jgi:hypothetical protein
VSEDPETYELEELAEQPGLYFNPKTEVIVAVDDSASVDQEAFDPVDLGGAEWVRISDEVPIDEQARDEALEAYQAVYHAGGSGSLSATVRDQEADQGDPDEPPPGPDPEDNPDSGVDEVDGDEGEQE